MPKIVNGKYIKYLEWKGKVTEAECIVHSYAWSGKIPCSGIEYCILCGKHKDED